MEVTRPSDSLPCSFEYAWMRVCLKIPYEINTSPNINLVKVVIFCSGGLACGVCEGIIRGISGS